MNLFYFYEWNNLSAPYWNIIFFVVLDDDDDVLAEVNANISKMLKKEKKQLKEVTTN